MTTARRLFIAAALALTAGGCADPVHDDAVNALGSEQAGVPKGPDHRPGQPCLTCHGGDGPASFEMAFAGTVYTYATGGAPVSHATVIVADANEHEFKTTTNCVGNFWIPKARFEPVFPANAALVVPGFTPAMQTKMNRDGSCNGCHTGAPTAASPGRIWVYPSNVTPPAVACSEGDQ